MRISRISLLLLVVTYSLNAQFVPTTSIPKCSGTRVTKCVPWVGDLGFTGIGLNTPATPLHIYSTRVSSAVADSQVYSQWEFGLGSNNAVSSVQGYYKNTGNTASATSHGIGVLGKVEDTTSGQITLFGAEGRVDGRANSVGNTHGYVGLVGASIFQGNARGAYQYGVEGIVSSTTDGTTPLTQGTSVAFYAPAITGGSTKYGLYINDPARVTDLSTDGMARVLSSTSATPSAGKGLELLYSSSLDYGSITSADRTGVAYKPLIVQGSLIAHYIGAVPMLSVSSSGIQLGAGTEPTCNSTQRGMVVMVQGGAGVADTLRVCRKDAANAYAWVALY